jgi:hypothetical protein
VPQLLRADIRPDRWFIYPEVYWLAPGEVQADALRDLRTIDNTLSVFEVDDPANVERIAIAVAAGRMKPDVMGYAVFDGSVLSARGLQLQRIPGKTADSVVNALHYDIQYLTGGQLNQLAGLMAQGKVDQILPKRVKQLIQEGLAAGHLDREEVNQKLLSQL